MSSDENVSEGEGNLDNIDENNDILEIGEDLGTEEPGEQTEEVQRDETADGGAEEGDKNIVKPKRVIRNPRPKLNEDTLKGPRGLTALPKYFERVKFKGKGHEKEDLNNIMKTYEYWCHRLFPKYPFDTCIEKIENLGKKKAVQTHIKRIRFDLFVEDKPIVDSSDEEANVDGFVDITNEQINQQNQVFDQMLPAQIVPLELTEEQKERIRLNKEKAEKLRAERLRKATEKAEERLEVSSQLPGTSGMNLSDDDEEGDIESVTDGISQRGTPDFDLESNIKGKARIGGSTVKKKGAARQENKENIENESLMDAEEVPNEDLNGITPLQKKDRRINRFADSDEEDSIHAPSIENGASLDVEESTYRTSFSKKNRKNVIADSDEEDMVQGSNISSDSTQNENSQKNLKRISRVVDNEEENSIQGLNAESSQDGEDTTTFQKKSGKIMDSDVENEVSNIKESSNDSNPVKMVKKKSHMMVDSDDDDDETLKQGGDQSSALRKNSKFILSDEESNSNEDLEQNGMDMQSDAPKSNN
ncbi:uncharacterized protein LOC126743115 [Anthonomus grandis grandis]|uniref:uncharacterized protein LOC126743115 n=1 Tax=Anthonomus grandis grandis TaxID=2921223 RepID=UPI0021656F75|nr:uncharacterized protein LOC126743115 [Anthonomus grandis grandis]